MKKLCNTRKDNIRYTLVADGVAVGTWIWLLQKFLVFEHAIVFSAESMNKGSRYSNLNYYNYTPHGRRFHACVRNLIVISELSFVGYVFDVYHPAGAFGWYPQTHTEPTAIFRTTYHHCRKITSPRQIVYHSYMGNGLAAKCLLIQLEYLTFFDWKADNSVYPKCFHLYPTSLCTEFLI